MIGAILSFHQFTSNFTVTTFIHFAYSVVFSVISVFSKSNGVFSCHDRYRYSNSYQSFVRAGISPVRKLPDSTVHDDTSTSSMKLITKGL